MRLILRFAFVCLLTGMSALMAQNSNKISNVYRFSMRDINAIKQNGKVVGYHAFFMADKSKKSDYSYKLVIFDENMKEVAQKNISSEKSLHLLESSYNGSLLCFKFYNLKEKKVSLKFYDNEAKLVSTKSYEVNKIEKTLINLFVKGSGPWTPSIYAVEGKGFVEYRTVKNDKVGYVMTFYPNDKSTRKWTKKSKTSSPVVETAFPMSISGNMIISSIVKKNNRMDREGKYFLNGVDASTGKELFEIDPTAKSKYTENILNAFVDETSKTIRLIGNYFPKGSKTIGEKSQGMVLKTMDFSGKIINASYVSWSHDVAKLIASSAKGKLDDIGFIYFHQFIFKQDGSIVGVGESFRKTASAGGIAVKALSLASGSTGSGSVAQLTIEDFYFFEFDKDFNLMAIKNFEKSITRQQLPAGAANYGPMILAMFAEYYGSFDYEDFASEPNSNDFAVYYRDYEKRKGEKNRSICGMISFTDGEYFSDKIDVPTEADYVKVLPGQGRNILFVEYYRKEKDIQMNFKKFNN